MASLASLALGTAPNARSLANVPGQTDVPLGQPDQMIPPRDPIYRVNPNGGPVPTPGVSTAATAAAPVAPHLTDYAAQYEQSLAASRANIEHQLGAALADINTKEASARQAVGLLPGQVNQVYDAGNASLGQSAASLDAAQHASGLQSYMGAGAQLAPIHAAIGADLAARQADVPLLNIGLAQAAAAEHAQLQQARLGAFDQLDQQQRAFLGQQMDAQRQAAATAQAQAFAHSEQTHAADLSLRNALTTASGTVDPITAYQLHLQQSGLSKAGITDVNAAEAQAARSNPLYNYAMGLVHSGKSLNQIFNDKELANPNVAKIIEVLNYDLGNIGKSVTPRGPAPSGSYFGYDASHLF